MNKLYTSEIYMDDVQQAINSTVNFRKLAGKSILITGASGLLGSFITDTLLLANKVMDSNITVYALGRNKKRLEARFDGAYTEKLHCIEHDINRDIQFDYSIDYIIHAASNAYPAVFHSDPVGTIMSNIVGTYNLLEYGRTHQSSRLLFVSSGEVYGQGSLSMEAFEESYSGYIDSMQVRSCYPNSKRNAETLCSAYTKQFGFDTVIVRPCHTYGPNAIASDNRANVQFINNVLRNEDIELKSAGNQMRSYCYIADCTSAILTVLLNGKSGQAYNSANPDARTTIAGFAKTAAKFSGCKVVFSEPDEVAIAERTPIEKQVLSSKKLEHLGWIGQYNIEKGIEHTIKILQNK